MDWIAWFDEWGTRVAVLLGLIATGLAIYSSVVAIRAKRDVGFRRAWIVTSGPSRDDSNNLHITIRNTTRDHARVIAADEAVNYFVITSPVDIEPDATYTFAATQPLTLLRIKWTRPGSDKVHTYAYRAARTPWKQRLSEAWRALSDSSRPR
ncbi:hypothetical protein [Pseudoclavibacter terrae]|uniref:Uncharacterized protein n=1 Tax=Pseudoclavibacter terrae TaxID=1530195 RepID=A0A7J5B6W8_9MICO|nr:hypothetical protein [Pseudoclavibacter terrae]KAB1639877.1 hypothetical protein F8O03_06090 [Pseudoclavibacter terrae]